MKKWSLRVLFGIVFLLVFIIGMTVIVDPYFHYHKPLGGMAYKLDDYEYFNDGVIRYFDYDAFIIGTSLTENTSVQKINELFNCNAVRLSLLGEGNYLIEKAAQKALDTRNVRVVIRGLDTMMFESDKDYRAHESYPDYLYDNNPFNDFQYVLNADIFVEKVVPELISTIRGERHAEFDDITNSRIGSRESVIENYDRPEKIEKKVTDEDLKMYDEMLRQNMEQNLLTTISENPTTTFYIYFPPYSILYWDSANQLGKRTLLRKIYLQKTAIELILQYDNVKLFSFFDDYELVTDLDNYCDEVHHAYFVNQWILDEMAKGSHQLTKENYEEYIKNITDFYTNYDYDSIFSEEGRK